MSAAERDLRGARTRPHHRAREAVVVEIGVPSKPRRLGPHGSREWNRLTRVLRLEQRLSESDRPALVIAAVAYESAAQIRAVRATHTIGSEIWTRLARAERLEWQLYQRALSDLCLTPATRARAPKPEKRGGTRFQEFMRAKVRCREGEGA